MRIIVVIKTSVGGLWLIPHVEEMRARGHDVLVVLPAEPGRLRDELGHRGIARVTSAFDFRFRPTWSTVAGLIALRRQIDDIGPDVLHYHLYASALAVRLASFGRGIPRIHMVAGPLYLDSTPIRMVERLLVRLDTITIGGSEFTSRRYRALGRTREETPSVPYGVDCDHFAPATGDARREARAALGLPQDAFVVVMVAFFYAPRRSVHAGCGIKGHDLLLQAWSRFSPQHPRARLLVVGSGFDEKGEDHRRVLREHVGRETDSSIMWLDSVRDVRPVYRAADVSVSPSRSENHGAAVEAGAMGVPSIVTRVGGLPEAVTDGGGWIVEPESVDGLALAFEDAHDLPEGALATMGRRARRHVVDNFERSACASAVADVIERAGPRETVSIFAEARIGQDHRGSWAARDLAHAAAAWLRYRGTSDEVRAVVRAERRAGSASVPLDGVEVEALPYYVGARGLLREAVPLLRALWRQVAGARRIVLRLPGVIGSLGAVCCRLQRRRYAVEVVGDPVDVLRSGVLGATGRLVRPLAGALLRWAVLGASSSLYVTREQLQRRYPPRPGTPTTGMTRALLEEADFVTAPRGYPVGPTRVITVGSQEQHYKGHDVLLRAVGLLKARGVPLSAVVVGGGRQHEALRALADGLGVSDVVSFTGPIEDRERLRELLDAATVFVLPSRAEGTSRALLEGMARGLPAVGTRVGGTGELLSDEMLCAPGDAEQLAERLLTVAQNPTRWEAESRANLAAAQRCRRSVLEAQFDSWLQTVPTARARRNSPMSPLSRTGVS